jgi:radical SAM superfamily enzyme YgiQ (UPF0313 family)
MKKHVVILFYPKSWEQDARGRIPYALLYLERMIRDLDIEIMLIDEQIDSDYLSIIEKVKDRMLIAGVSAMTGFQIQGAIQFSKLIKEHSDAPVVWGGWHATLLPEQVLSQSYIDFVITGQGELPLQQLIKQLLVKGNYHHIKGLGYKIEKKTTINKNADFQDINHFPAINYDLINVNNYVFKSAYSKRCIGYFTSHGCPYNCAFCCVAEVYKHKWYSKKIKVILQELKYLSKTAQIDSVTFDDDNFFVNKRFCLEFAQALIDSKLNLMWDTSAHAGLFLKLFSDKEVNLLYKSGCRQIYIGAESGDQEVLDMIAKNATVEDNFSFLELLSRHDIIPLFSTMVCLPSDPDRDIAMTFDMIRKAKLKNSSLRARVFFYTPYPGTDLYKKAIEKGFAPPSRLEDWVSHTLRKFHAPWWTHDYRAQVEIFVNFYLPLRDPLFYRKVPEKFRTIAYCVNKLYFPFAYFRFKWNIFRFPLEAISFLSLLKIFNKIMKTRFSLGFESYME